MSNDIEQKRQRIADEYSSKTWQAKVAKMSDGQVIAVFNNFRRQGKVR